MKILYVARIDENYALDLGVAKKIKGQITAFNNLGYTVDYLRMIDKKIYFNEEECGSVRTRYFAYIQFYNILRTKIVKNQYKFAYLRYVKGSERFLKTVKLLNKRETKSVVEIPTYPYKQELKVNNLLGLKTLVFDILISKRINKYVNVISVTNDIDEIFSIDTVVINNGINISDYQITLKDECAENKINLIGIANLARWHGYDRLIQGIAEYNKSKKETDLELVFYIVGNGDEKSKLIKLSQELDLEQNVKFTGAMSGEKLESLFKKMDIGVSSLGLHRAGGGHDPIKTKEFIARGLPVILGYEDRLVDMNLPYILKVEENDTSIDMNSVVDLWLENNTEKKRVEIREYAKKNLSWEKQMEKVISKIKKSK